MAKRTNPNRSTVRVKKKPAAKHYTQKEKNTLIACTIAAIVIILVIVFVPDMVRKARNLKVKDDVIQGLEANELACDISTKGAKEYRKLCRVDSVPAGYALSSTEPGITDNTLRYFTYKPEGEGCVQGYYVQPGTGSAKYLAENMPSRLASFTKNVLLQSEVGHEVINGHDAYWYELRYTMEVTDTEATDGAEAQYVQFVALNLQSDYEEETVVINAQNTGYDESVFADSDEIIALLKEAAAGITIEK